MSAQSDPGSKKSFMLDGFRIAADCFVCNPGTIKATWVHCTQPDESQFICEYPDRQTDAGPTTAPSIYTILIDKIGGQSIGHSMVNNSIYTTYPRGCVQGKGIVDGCRTCTSLLRRVVG